MEEEFEKIEKPITDKREYQFFKLDNGMKVMLVSLKNLLPPGKDPEDLMQKEEPKHTHHHPHHHHKKHEESADHKPSDEKQTISEEESSDIDDDEEGEDDDEDFDSEDSKSADSDKEAKTKPKGKASREGLAAICLSVAHGSMDDPADMPGLAHLLEHSIMMGSKEFPEESSFMKFIAQRGGYENACTKMNETAYEMEIGVEHLEEVLYRLSRNFKNPLFNVSSIRKELKAIENEFEIALVDESIKHFQVLLHNLPQTNLLHRFAWGNAKSLDREDSKLEAAVKKFYSNYYGAQNLTLSIVSTLPLENMSSLVKKHFEDLPKFGKEDAYKTNKELYAAHFKEAREHFPGFWFLKSVQEMKKVIFTWTVPSLHDHFESQPLSLLLTVFDDRGKGSLYQHLKERMLITSFSVGTSLLEDQINEVSFIPMLEIKLTDEGVAKVAEVIFLTFQFLNKLTTEGIPSYIFDEEKTMGQLQFDYGDNLEDQDLANCVASGLKYVAPKKLLKTFVHGVVEYYNEELMKKVLECLKPQFTRVDIQMNELPPGLASCTETGILDHIEPWFEVSYAKLVPKKLLPETYIDQIAAGYYSPDLKYPGKNSFLPQSVKLQDKHEKLLTPVKLTLEDQPLSEIWVSQDLSFLIPKVSTSLIIITSNSAEVTDDAFYLGFLIGYLESMYEEKFGNEAKNAGIECDFRSYYTYGIEIVVYCFSDSLERFLIELAEFIKSEIKAPNEAMHDLLLQRAITANKQCLEEPEDYISSTVSAYLFPHVTTPEFEIEFMTKTANFKSFTSYLQGLSEGTRLRKLIWYFHGDITSKQALQYVRTFTSRSEMDKVKPQEHSVTLRMRKISVVDWIIPNYNKKNKNNYVVHYIDADVEKLETRVLVVMLNQVFDSELFHELRTIQNVGYIANSSNRTIVKQRNYIEVWISSTKFTCTEINEKLDKFYQYFVEEYMQKMTTEDFDKLRRSFIAAKKQPYASMEDDAMVKWQEINTRYEIFDRKEREIEFLEKLELKDLIEWGRKILRDERKLLKVGLMASNSEVEINYDPLLRSKTKINDDAQEFWVREAKYTF